MLFVESRVFSAKLKKLLSDEAYRQIQNELLQDPEKGDVMQDCGGLRKVRTSDPGRSKGKRGGCRIIYLHTPEADRLDMVAIYSKAEQDDLTDDERLVLRDLARRARAEAIRAHRAKGR